MNLSDLPAKATDFLPPEFPGLNALNARWYRLALRSGYAVKVLGVYRPGMTQAEAQRELGITRYKSRETAMVNAVLYEIEVLNDVR